jgi:transposase-like protein
MYITHTPNTHEQMEQAQITQMELEAMQGAMAAMAVQIASLKKQNEELKEQNEFLKQIEGAYTALREEVLKSYE